MVEAGSQAKTKIKLMTHEFKHPKFYTELRKRNKTDQAISNNDGLAQPVSVRPDSGLKRQASSNKQQAGEAQASSYKDSSSK
jgi:hypothetical protein